MLSDDDVDLANLTDEELAQAWDLWFDLAQSTNDDDPLHTHGVFQRLFVALQIPPSSGVTSASGDSRRRD